MKDFILKGYEVLTVLIPFLITFVILNLLYKKKEVVKSHGHFFLVFIFAVYIFGVFHFTGAGTIFDVKLYGLEIKAGQLNFLPFSDTNIDIVAYLLNIILFLPFGFLLPYIWPNFNRLKRIVISGFSFSLLIEISQLLNNRRTDIDDLLLNTLGALFGYLLFRLFAHITKRIDNPMTVYKYEAVIYILATFLCRFFTYNEFGLAKILYGF
ncbi:VanZ family protein [Aminipila sp.]|uniref:VanZ family protein n=1 Tax=Aminipila sp. TaxID=2060095 RepID=UPI00289F02D2|nr:VanZ family protein [Aminipila sp.]